jgi:hypothetical protein
MNPIRNETSLVLVIAVLFSAIAIPALSGFLEPSQPPAVAAVQIGDPRDNRGGSAVRDDGGSSGAPAVKPQPKAEPESRAPRPADDEAGPADDDAEPRRPAKRPDAPAPSAQPAPAAPADDAVEDDGGED